MKQNVSRSGAWVATLAAACLSGSLYAQAGGQGGSNSMQSPTNPTSRDGTAGATNHPEKAGVTSGAKSNGTGTTSPGKAPSTARGSPDNTNAKSSPNTGGMDSWITKHAETNKGRISREAYMNELARRWDMADKSHQGLTPAEVSRLTGNVDVDAGPAKTGSGVQAGNMGPGNAKAQ
jgi:hypothetical protein